MRARAASAAPGASHPLRRASDRGTAPAAVLRRRRSDIYLNVANWTEQRTQFITRYVFAALGLAYFNYGELVARSDGYLMFANGVHIAYLLLTTTYLLHALRHPVALWRLRGAMWTDLIAVSGAIFADSNLMSPAYLVYLVIILGNGMRYGLRAFAEAAIGSLITALAVLGARFADTMQSITIVSAFFLLFVTIVVLYAYVLMTNIERARAGLEAASRNDSLTGLLNRRGLYEHSQPWFDALRPDGTPLAVLFADLDGFKAINDRYGHDVGDRVLQQVAQAIIDTIRAQDMAARFGGDEFVVIMPYTTQGQASAVAQRLQHAIDRALAMGDAAVSLTIGVGEAPLHGPNLDQVLKQVDTAMYQGKQGDGRGGIRLVAAAG